MRNPLIDDRPTLTSFRYKSQPGLLPLILFFRFALSRRSHFATFGPDHPEFWFQLLYYYAYFFIPIVSLLPFKLPFRHFSPTPDLCISQKLTLAVAQLHAFLLANLLAIFSPVGLASKCLIFSILWSCSSPPLSTFRLYVYYRMFAYSALPTFGGFYSSNSCQEGANCSMPSLKFVESWCILFLAFSPTLSLYQISPVGRRSAVFPLLVFGQSSGRKFVWFWPTISKWAPTISLLSYSRIFCGQVDFLAPSYFWMTRNPSKYHHILTWG